MRRIPYRAVAVFAVVLAVLLAGAAAAGAVPQRILQAGGVCGANPGPPDSANPAIFVTEPLAGGSSTSPLAVAGQAQVFEGVVSLALKDAGGATIVAGTTQATGGAPARAPFTTSLSFSVASVTPACLWVFESSARDGSPINVVQVPVTLVPVQPNVPITYPAGWNLIGVPNGSTIPGPLGPFYTFQAGDTAYQAVQNLQQGLGYWAFFATPTTASLPFTGPRTVTMLIPARQYVMVGNPGSAAAILSGADVAYVYDSATGYRQTDQIPPGQGAWVFSSTGSRLTITSGPR